MHLEDAAVVIPDSEFANARMPLSWRGTSPNPLISSTTEGLEINKWKCIIAEETNDQTSKNGVFAGGDAVTECSYRNPCNGSWKAEVQRVFWYLF